MSLGSFKPLFSAQDYYKCKTVKRARWFKLIAQVFVGFLCKKLSTRLLEFMLKNGHKACIEMIVAQSQLQTLFESSKSYIPIGTTTSENITLILNTSLLLDVSVENGFERHELV